MGTNEGMNCYLLLFMFPTVECLLEPVAAGAKLPGGADLSEVAGSVGGGDVQATGLVLQWRDADRHWRGSQAHR